MPRSRHHLIVGAGTAGLAALEAIRRARPGDQITMVSAEPDWPYSPTVLPHLLAGRIAESQVALRSETFFAGARCRVLLCKEAIAIDADRRRVRFADGTDAGWDALLLATGSEPLVPALANPQGVELLAFTRLADLRRLRSRLHDGDRVAILGAGLIGMELGEALVSLRRGIRVTIVEQERQVLPRTFGARLGAAIEELFRAHAVACRLETRAVAVEPAGPALALTLSDGSSCAADLVVACVGVRPRVGSLAGSGLATGRGVLVDRRMASSFPGVFAAGDVAEAPSAEGERGCHPVLPTAAAQGRVAGANMAGRVVEHEGWVPASIFNFFGRTAISVGASDPGPASDRVVRRTDDGQGELLLDGERLLGASFVDVPADPGALAWLVRARAPVRAYAEQLVERPLEVARWLVGRAQRGAA